MGLLIIGLIDKVINYTYKKETRERLDKFLQSDLENISRHQIKKIILNGQVLVNNKIPTVHHWLKKGDKISYQKPTIKTITKSEALKIPIIASEKDYLIINKPSGILVHPTEKKENDTLTSWLLAEYPTLKKVGDDAQRPGIVHRLDREASGLMVIALNQKSFNHLKKQFQSREIKKEYSVLVHGSLINDSGEINSALERDKKTGKMKAQTVKDSGREAHTIYEVEKKFQNYSLLKVQIKTGRSHQIRAHLYSIGHSVVGDKIYQTKDIRKKKKIIDNRIFLHATKLSFKNLDGAWVKYSSPLPKNLKDFLKTIK